MTDPYELLGLPADAEIDAIRQRILAQEQALSRLADDPSPDVRDRAARDLADLAEARAILLDPERRSDHDRARSDGGQEQPEPQSQVDQARAALVAGRHREAVDLLEDLVLHRPADVDPAAVTELLCRALIAEAESLPRAEINGQKVVTHPDELQAVNRLLERAAAVAPNPQWRSAVAQARERLRAKPGKGYWPGYPKFQAAIAYAIGGFGLFFIAFRPDEAANMAMLWFPMLAVPAVWVPVAVARRRRPWWQINAIKAGVPGASERRGPSRPTAPQATASTGRPGTTGGVLALCGSVLLLLSTFMPWGTIGFGMEVNYWDLAQARDFFEDDSTYTTLATLLMIGLIIWWTLYLTRPRADQRRNWAIGGLVLSLLLCVIASPVYEGFEGTDEVGPILGGIAILAILVGNGAAVIGTVGKSRW